MKSLIKLFNEWEIQQLVLLSFTLQLYLFFTGSLRRHSSSRFLRYSIWIAYLGADLVAVYALGLLSRHDRDITFESHVPRTQTLASFWAPFLLIHLGGQDTITAFAMEDNNLWLRHLLNLVAQVVLALYVYSKSIRRLHNVELVVSGILVFVAGIIKYGERTWSLKCGNLKSLESSTGHRFNKRVPADTDGYPGIVSAALGMMPRVLKTFAARVMYSRFDTRLRSLLEEDEDPNKMAREMRIELGLMYDDLYTKAVMLRTRNGIVLRCISQISIVAAFALFHAQEDKWSTYSEADIAITYSLFIGGLLLELCSVFVFMMSPWTWAWLKVRNWHRLAGLSWFIFSSDIGWPEKKQGWPNSMGQYNLVSWLAPDNSDLQRQARRTFSQRAMRRLFLDLFGAKKKNIFWMSKLLDTEYVDVDNMMIECVTKEIVVLASEVMKGTSPREWSPNLQEMLAINKDIFVKDFGSAIVNIHVQTELLLSQQQTWSDMDAKMVEVCRKLSNYMMYLLVTHPSMLPLTISATQVLMNSHSPELLRTDSNSVRHPISKETLEEMVCMWARILAYVAGKSKVESHVAHLSTGGELITFAWLFMSYCQLGDCRLGRIQITSIDAGVHVREVYAFGIPHQGSSEIPSGPVSFRKKTP